jgi:hypothetical protein
VAVPAFFARSSLAVAGALGAPEVTAASLEARLATFIVEIVCPESALASDYWTAELLVNLLARLYPSIRITAPPPAKLRLERVARSINPNSDLTNTGAASVTVAVGDTVGLPQGALHVRSDGWVARLSTAPWSAPRGPANPYAAAAAACFAAAEVFRRAFADNISTPARDNISVSLLDFSAEAGALDGMPEVMDVGETAFAGVGAVAAGAIWAMARHAGLRGDLHLIDPQVAELSNLQRYVLLDMEAVGRPKVKVAAKALARPGITVKMHRTTLERVAGERGRGFCTICASPDNVDGRRAAQGLLPRLVLNGWTKDTGLGVSWHRFTAQAPCLCCLYMPSGKRASQSEVIAQTLGLETREAADLYLKNAVPSVEQLRRIAEKARAAPEVVGAWQGKSIREIFTAVCGAANLNVREDGQPEAVPLAHQSALAGVLMAAELVKRATPELAAKAQGVTAIAWHDATGPAPTSWMEPVAKEPGCICSDPTYRRAYFAKWGTEVVPSADANLAPHLTLRKRAPLPVLEAVDGA